ncbi:uncharacterized protein [Spinacia oleracea]|uniref:Endonuclease/exonuclease/phosphatase domain-containing protein n=1 Tax=Spinacia oleracea TaxID=3562 RepID=A0A9R0IIV2_SPIOL|nr:uncharacterized protein LOC110789755 [Spinacia oleracea]
MEILFVYGAPNVEDRLVVWGKMLDLILAFPTCLVLGDFNQLDLFSDKLGGSSSIKVWEEFIQWKLASNLSDVPFSGPPFTWSNKREDTNLILERLDRAYMSTDWFLKYPDSRVTNQPILISDHAAIVFETSHLGLKKNRPYQLEAWCLLFPDIASIVEEVWNLVIVGSPMFTLSRKLGLARNRIRNWCLKNKKSRGINWKQFSDPVNQSRLQVSDLQSGSAYMEKIDEMHSNAML